MIPTPEEIHQMPAGADLDKLIAEKVMCLEYVRQGWLEYVYGDIIIWEENDDNDSRLKPALLHGEDRIVASYSTSIASAWQVVDKLTVEGWGHKHQVFSAAAEMPGWQWTFMRPGGGLGAGVAGAEADTAMLAICRAALRTLPQ